MNEKENSLRTLFVEAVEITDAAERAAYVQRACGDDASLRRRIEQLLKAHADAGESTSAEGETNVILPATEKPGDRIGRYKLREQIGAGGCGVVYIAEQEEPVRRGVALKVIKLGMDTRQIIARFEAERQALAMMDHPSIARVLDAGATDTGRPYFVMELVRGIKITDYCDQNTLSTKERLDLFAQVCRAIQHAHQKGIIHRDIKPSNILVTLHDGLPVPKVIDFGIAKATEGRLTDVTVHTELHQFIGTPAYMSPEQAEMSGLDIDTRSDIYSLGVLLYELLTGRTPFEVKALLEAGLDEMRRIIREVEPPRPSLRLSTVVGGDQTELAKARHIEPGKLSRTVAPDLDWIVMKAIEKDRARRYETANGLALDIQRFLADEPVSARPPSAGYRLRKFARRNKLGLSAVVAVAAALVAGLIASLWQADRATRAEREQSRLRQRAEASQKRSEGEAAKATASELQMRHYLYAADMNRVQDALRVNNLGRARRLLDGHRPKPGELDLRGWEWRYLWQQCRSGAIATLTKRTARAVSVSFSADSKRLAVAFVDGRLEVWDVSSRTLARAIQTDESGRSFSVRFGPRGWVLTHGSRDGIKLYDFASDEPPTTVALGGYVVAFSFSRDGSSLLCRTDSTFKLVDLARMENITAGPPFGFTAYQPAGDVRVAPARALYFVGHESGRALTVGVFRQSDDVRESEIMVGNDDGLFGMDISPDGKLLVTSTGWEDSVVRVWDTGTFKQLAQLDRHTAWVSELTFSPDGRSLASASADQTIRLWDTRTWQESAVLRGHGDEVWTVAFSPDGKLLASGAKDGEVLLWNSEAPPAVRGRFDLPHDVEWARQIPGEPWILTQSASGKHSVWSLRSFTESNLPTESKGMRGRFLEIGRNRSPNGRFEAKPSETGIVRLRDHLLNRDLMLQGHLLAVDEVAFSPDSKRLVTTSGGREAAKIWDPETGQELLNLGGRGVNLYSAKFSEDGNVLIVGALFTPGFWQLWRAPSWDEIESAEGDAGKWPQTVAATQISRAPTLPELQELAERAERSRPQAAYNPAPGILGLEERLETIAQSAARNPQNSLLSLYAAALQVWLGKNSDHLTTSRRTLKQAADAETASVAERVAKAYCLRPSSDPQLLEAAVALARESVSLGEASPELPWYQMTLGMAEYRQGNFPAAEQALIAAEANAETSSSPYHVRLTAGFFRAMSLVGQGKGAEARRCFTQSELKMRPMPADDKSLMESDTDHDDLILWLAYKEAKAQLRAETPQKSETN